MPRNQYLPLKQLYGYSAYRDGQSVFHYPNKKCGEENQIPTASKAQSVEAEPGDRLNLEELSGALHGPQGGWPDIAKREDPATMRGGSPITRRRRFCDHQPGHSQGRQSNISFQPNDFCLFVMNAVDGGQ
jgi:hypothetical protein